MRRAGIDDEIRGNLFYLSREKQVLCSCRNTERWNERSWGVFLFVATDASESIEFEVSNWGRDEKKKLCGKGGLTGLSLSEGSSGQGHHNGRGDQSC